MYIEKPPQKALIAITSLHARLHSDNEEAGLLIAEAIHSYREFDKAGFDVDFVSQDGKSWPGRLSLEGDWLGDQERGIFEDHRSTFRLKLDHMRKTAEVNPHEYGVFLAIGGDAAVNEFPNAKELQNVAAQIYANGGIISTAWNGVAILPRILDIHRREPIIKGRGVAGPSPHAQPEAGAAQKTPSAYQPASVNAAMMVGAKCVCTTPGSAVPFVHADGRIVTSSDPQSSQSCAQTIIRVFGSL